MIIGFVGVPIIILSFLFIFPSYIIASIVVPIPFSFLISSIVPFAFVFLLYCSFVCMYFCPIPISIVSISGIPSCVFVEQGIIATFCVRLSTLSNLSESRFCSDSWATISYVFVSICLFVWSFCWFMFVISGWLLFGFHPGIRSILFAAIMNGVL